MGDDGSKSSFGFRDVPRAEKERLVRGVFSSVASRYDLMNDVMSVGLHRVWKSAFVTRVNPQAGETLIDLAAGTGDIAREFLARADERPGAAARPARALLCDINVDMLAAGASGSEAQDRLMRVCADAGRLPLADRTADAATIAFGIRNVADIGAALSEAFRILKIGGRFWCLEFSHPVTGGLQALYDAYSFNAIPFLGEAVAKDRASYQYLVESIRRFPRQDAFAALLTKAGFARVKYENLTGGVVAIHCGWRL
jgi:demethylmenaquinone methyltransferase/2-methoxy-6-polyprenyl-1,4-benzoquinol methylase